MKLNKYEMFFFGFLNNFVYFQKKLRILVNGQAMATWPDVLKIAKMAKNSHLWTHCTTMKDNGGGSSLCVGAGLSYVGR
jgi:hypothetical protein